MIVTGRDRPVVHLYREGSVLKLRVDFELYPSGWAEVEISPDDLKRAHAGEQLTKKSQFAQTSELDGGGESPTSPR